MRVIDDEGLRQVEEWLAGDPVGSAVFGGFYGRAVERWTPLLSAPERHGWITYDDSGPIGFIDLEILDAEAEISYYVCPARRLTGLGRATVDQVVRLASENGARFIHAAVEPTNLPSLALLRAAAFTESGPNEYGETEFEMSLHA
ncbi:GNAT family N-acetyltransferase [Kribbella qitaiheensis]|uniref:GNAT family N-acetyltransferase n=1 Tax=Kribbella qitaiheensis TaxID=1544730 RepID=A0A7G6XA88_9ACTN|nr:GNAT family N-acetyltransferase [Kribbella qitaiheensis]